MTECEELAESIRKKLLYDSIPPNVNITWAKTRFLVQMMLGDESATLIDSTTTRLYQLLRTEK